MGKAVHEYMERPRQGRHKHRAGKPPQHKENQAGNRKAMGTVVENKKRGRQVVEGDRIPPEQHPRKSQPDRAQIGEQGVALPVIQRLMGHTSLRTTQLYLHVTNQHLETVRSPLDLLRLPGEGEVLE